MCLNHAVLAIRAMQAVALSFSHGEEGPNDFVFGSREFCKWIQPDHFPFRLFFQPPPK
jgi:hypothetical protein